MAEDLEEFRRKRDSACNGGDRRNSPATGRIPIELIVK